MLATVRVARVLPTAAAVIAAAAAPAYADPPPEFAPGATESAQLRQDQRIALRFWRRPRPPCRITYVEAQMTMQSGWADRRTCTIWLDEDLFWFWSDDDRAAKRRFVCVLVAHEIGHLLGRKHSRNPRRVMYSGQLDPAAVPRCDALERPAS
jgi:hypothetical protein